LGAFLPDSQAPPLLDAVVAGLGASKSGAAVNLMLIIA
jgi:hypothetical protein